MTRPLTPGRILSIVSALVLHQAVNAQTAIPPLGQANMTELDLTHCDFDSLAPAMYLLNSQETKVEQGVAGDYWSATTKRFRIKIFNQQGFKYANVKFPVYTGKYRKLSDIKGYIFYKDSLGKIITQRITRQEIFKDKVAKGVTSIAYVFPNVRPGCVVEFTYEDRYSIRVPTWTLGTPIPTLTAFCKVEVPAARSIDQKIVVYGKLQKSDTTVGPSGDARLIRTFTINNIPSFKPEPLMGQWKNNIQRIEFALNMYSGLKGFFGNDKWKGFNEFVYSICARIIDADLPGSDTLIDKARKMNSTSAKVGYLFEELQKKLTWDEVHAPYTRDITTAWKEKTGNSAELNMILMNLLHRADVPFAPIMVSTRENGRVDTSFANPSQFDGIDIVVLDANKNYIVDLTQKNLPYTVTPNNVINTLALLVDSTRGQWVRIADPRPLYRQSFIIFSSLDSTGLMSGTATIQHYDHAKNAKFASIKEENDEESAYMNFGVDEKNITIDEKKTEEPQETQLPFVETFKFKLELPASGDLISMNPSFLTEFKDNPFTGDRRAFDIDMGSNQSLSINLNMTLPVNYVVDELPKNITLIKSDSAIIFKRLMAVQGNTLQCLIKLDYKESYFPKEDYPDLKEFLLKMYGYLNEPVVLRKKN